MPPRGGTLPAAATDSAREARRNFFCDLCQKGYARMNELETHEGSYDHQHRKRMKEMKVLMRDPNATAKREAERRAEEKSTGMRLNITSAATSTTSATPRKAPVFKKVEIIQNSIKTNNRPAASTHEHPQDDDIGGEVESSRGDDGLPTSGIAVSDDPTQAKANGWYEDRYRPNVITTNQQCESGCRVCEGREIVLDTAVEVDFEARPDEGAGIWKQWWIN